MRYNSKVVLRKMQEGDLMLRKVVVPALLEKAQPNLEGSYHICHDLPDGAYKI